MAARRTLLTLAALAGAGRGIKVGDMLPDVALHQGFPPEMVSTKSLCSGRKIVIVGLPGAFTPT